MSALGEPSGRRAARLRADGAPPERPGDRAVRALAAGAAGVALASVGAAWIMTATASAEGAPRAPQDARALPTPPAVVVASVDSPAVGAGDGGMVAGIAVEPDPEPVITPEPVARAQQTSRAAGAPGVGELAAAASPGADGGKRAGQDAAPANTQDRAHDGRVRGAESWRAWWERIARDHEETWREWETSWGDRDGSTWEWEWDWRHETARDGDGHHDGWHRHD